MSLQRAAGNHAVARLVGERQESAAADGPPPPAPPPPATGAPAPAGTALPAPLAAMAGASVVQMPALLQAGGIAVSQLGNEANVRAYDKNKLTGPVPTGLPTGPEPAEPPEPVIPDAGNITPAGDGDSPADIAAAAQGGRAQIEASSAAAERAAAADTGVGQLAPTEDQGEIPELGLDFVWPTGGPPPIPTTSEPEVVAELEGAFGAQGREVAARELAGGAALLAHHDEAVDKQHADAAEQLTTANEQARLEQVAAREEARLGVEADKAQLRRENAAAIAEYQRKAAAEQAAAQAEVERAREEARKAEEAAKNQPQEEEEDRPWYSRAWSAVKSGAKWVGGKVKDAVVTAYRFVKDRVSAFFSKVAELVSDGIDKLREIGGRIYRGIRDKIKAGLRKLNEIAHRIGRWVADLAERVGRFISGLVKGLVDGFLGFLERIANFFRRMWEIAVQIKDFIVALAKGAVQLFIELIRDPGAVLERAKGAILEQVQKTPGKVEEVYHQYIGPIFDKPAAGAAPAAAAAGGATLARQPVAQDSKQEPATDTTEPAQGESHSEGVWRHLKVRGNYFVENWWGVVKDAAFEILVPFVAIYRHLPKAFESFIEAWHEFKRGNYSRMTDSILDGMRELMAIFVTVVAQVSIAAFIIGSIIGTPIVGFAVLEGIGLAVIGADVALQVATIIKAVTNFNDDDEDEEHLEKDYGRIADSSVAVAVMLALILLGAVASKAASSLIARFPALSRAAEALKVRIRRRLGIKPPEAPSAIASKMRPLEAKPPEAVGYPVREKLTPDEQIAFDKFVAERKSDPHQAIDGKTPDQVRQMLRNQLEWVAEENAKVAENAKWQGDLMDPKMDHPPAKVPSAEGDVWVRYNKVGMTTKEIEEAGRLSSRMGMRVDLFGDNFPGIDGVASSGSTRVPVQLKGLTGAESAADAARVAKAAFDKAGAAGFTGVEVYIEAPHLSIAEVRAEFGKLARADVIDGKVVMRVRVLCKDGVYEPALPDPIKAPHPGPDVKDPDRDKDKDRVPVGVGG